MAARVDVLFCFRCEWWAEAGGGPRAEGATCPRCRTPLYLVGGTPARRPPARPRPDRAPEPPPRLALVPPLRPAWAAPPVLEVDPVEATEPDEDDHAGGPFGVRAAVVAMVVGLLAVAYLSPREPPPPAETAGRAAEREAAVASGAGRVVATPEPAIPATAVVPEALLEVAGGSGVSAIVFVGPEGSPGPGGDRPDGHRIWHVDLVTGTVERGPAVPATSSIRPDPRSGGRRFLVLSRGGTLLLATLGPHDDPVVVAEGVSSFAVRRDGTILVARHAGADPATRVGGPALVTVTPIRIDDGRPAGRASRIALSGLDVDEVMVHPGRVLASGVQGDGRVVARWSALPAGGGPASRRPAAFPLPEGFAVRRVVGWSPDGRLLAVTGATSVDGRLGLFLLGEEGSGLLLRWTDRLPVGASFSGDSALLSWIENDSVFVLDLATGDRHAVRLAGATLPVAARLTFA